MEEKWYLSTRLPEQILPKVNSKREILERDGEKQKTEENGMLYSIITSSNSSARRFGGMVAVDTGNSSWTRESKGPETTRPSRYMTPLGPRTAAGAMS